MKQERRAFVRAGTALLALPMLGARAMAQDAFPRRPVRCIVGYPPGGAVDMNARLIGDELSRIWNQSVVIENRGGAGSTIGTAAAAQATPDGYTFLVVSPAHAINATLYKKLPYDTAKSFTAVARLTDSPLTLFVHPSVPANSVRELIALAKEKPGKLNYGSSGNGTSVHLAGAMFNMLAETDIMHIPYNGGGAAYNALLAGEVHMMFGGVEGIPHARAGKLKALAVTTATRFASMPDIPTVAESGLPGYEVDAWYGVYVPAGTPRAIVEQMNRDINKALQAPAVQQKYAQMGFSVAHTTPEEFAQFTEAEIEKWRKVVTFAGAGID